MRLKNEKYGMTSNSMERCHCDRVLSFSSNILDHKLQLVRTLHSIQLCEKREECTPWLFKIISFDNVISLANRSVGPFDPH